MTEPVLCPPHTRRVDVLDHVTVHEHDGQRCDAEPLVRGNEVVTAEQIRDEQQTEPEEGATA